MVEDVADAVVEVVEVISEGAEVVIEEVSTEIPMGAREKVGETTAREKVGETAAREKVGETVVIEKVGAITAEGADLEEVGEEIAEGVMVVSENLSVETIEVEGVADVGVLVINPSIRETVLDQSLQKIRKLHLMISYWIL